MKHHTKKGQAVDFLEIYEDRMVLDLGIRGRSTRYIAKKTGYTECMVTYRLKAGSVPRMKIRNGEHPLTQMMDKLIDPTDMDHLIRAHVRKHL